MAELDRITVDSRDLARDVDTEQREAAGNANTLAQKGVSVTGEL